MKKTVKAWLQLLLLLIIPLASSCSTSPDTIADSLTPPQFFQRAQEASDNGNYELALRYYATFKERFPEELERDLWASYEIAFLHHKMGKDERALELLDELLEQYALDASVAYPQGPRILAEKVKARLEEKLKR